MVAANVSLDRVLDLASQLTPREQAELLVRIGQRLERLFLEETPQPGTPEAILKVIKGPPHVDPTIVDEMEAAIREGQQG